MRADRAFALLTNAFLNGELKAGSHRSCAVATLIRESLGREVDWFNILERVSFGEPLSDADLVLIQEIEDRTGFSIAELMEIEAAFEGDSLRKDERRVSMSDPARIEDRFIRTLRAIKNMDQEVQELA